MQSISGGNLSRVKVSNQAAIRRIIYEYGPITRAEISEKLGLTLPTITTNINSMISAGILTEVEPDYSNSQVLGRRANPIDFVADSKFFIGIEMRKHFRHLCITDYRGNVLLQKVDESSLGDYDMCISATCRMLNDVIASCIIPSEHIGGIGFCVAGMVDPESGILQSHPQNNWSNKNIVDDIRRLTSYNGPITLENNTIARAYGVRFFNKELLHNSNSFTYFFIFTGIACPLIINSAFDLSTPIGPGEVGHMIVEPHQSILDQETGMLESISSETAILQSCQHALNSNKAPILKELCNGKKLDFSLILKAQAMGDTGVSDILKTALYYLSIAAANIDNFIRPDLMFMESRLFSVPENRTVFLDALKEHLFRSNTNEAVINFIDYDSFSGARGACAVAVRNDLKAYIP